MRESLLRKGCILSALFHVTSIAVSVRSLFTLPLPKGFLQPISHWTKSSPLTLTNIWLFPFNGECYNGHSFLGKMSVCTVGKGIYWLRLKSAAIET